MIDVTLTEAFIYAIVAGFGAKIGWNTIPSVIVIIIATIFHAEPVNDSQELRNITKAIEALKRTP